MIPKPLLSILTLIAATFVAQLALADVVVLANRTNTQITAKIGSPASKPFQILLAVGEVRPLLTDHKLQLAYSDSRQSRTYPLELNAAYYFGTDRSGQIDLQQIGFGEEESLKIPRTLPGDAQSTPVAEITVKLLVDEEEVTRRQIWEPRLRARIAKASAILEKHSGVRLKVIAVSEWRSDNALNDFSETLGEFEKQVDPAPARLALGFTSQYEAKKGRIHLGGTRGPLRKHILLRDWTRHQGENEQLELLTHELGHFLGASHSPEPTSVMRPVIGKLSRLKDFEIRYDPVNTLIMAMVGEEIRRRDVDHFRELTPATLVRIKQIYATLGQALPKDPSAQRLSREIRITRRQVKPTGRNAPAKQVLNALTQAAKPAADAEPLIGDALTEQCVRVAAAEAAKLPEKVGPKALLVALGIGLGDAEQLYKWPPARRHLEDVESNGQRTTRLRWVSQATVAGRTDLAKHFFVSAGLTGVSGARQADTLGLAKEVLDAQGGSGFSFVDLAADRAGVRFAEGVMSGKFKLHTLAKNFQVAHFMPPIEGLKEGLTNEQLTTDYGGKGDKRFDAVTQAIEKRIDGLPAHFKFEMSF